MDKLIDVKVDNQELEVEFEVLPMIDSLDIQDERRKRILHGISSLDDQLSVINERIDELNKDIDRLTNHADGIDYSIAVISGIITGIIDSTIVGEWNFSEAKKDTYKNIHSKVIDFAKKQPNYIPYCNTTLENLKKIPPKDVNPRRKPKDPNRLETAIEFLEFQFHLPGDGAYSTGKFGIDGNTHRLDDLCHHPTIVGLVCCVIVQFTGNTLYVNKYGEDINIPITVNEYGNFVGKNPITKLFAGIINWFITCAKTIANRKGHLMSDISTSKSLPGSFLSTITELASIPCFRNEDFLLKLRDAFNNGFGNGKGQIDLGVFNKLFEGAKSRWDVTTEKAVMHELKRQAVPIVINEILVRASYFIRKFILELKCSDNVKSVNWKNVIPFNNRTIVRMMTIASATFTTIDMADAAIRSATKSVDVTSFFSNMILRVNFVGVGRLAIAVATDAGMGVSKGVKKRKVNLLRQEETFLLEAKVYYKQADMWISAEDTGKTIDEAYKIIENNTSEIVNHYNNINESMTNIGGLITDAENNNPGLSSELLDILDWD